MAYKDLSTNTKKARIRANAKYDKANTKIVMLKLNINTDQDILEKLQKQESKMGYIKELIRQDIAMHPDK